MAELSPPTVVAAVSEALMQEFFSAADHERLHDAARALGGGFVRVDDIADVTERSAVRVVITSWGAPAFDADLLASLPSVQLVAHTGASIRALVTDALWERGVIVTQAGAAMARPVAEVSLTFTLALLHRIPQMHEALRSGGWYDPAAVGVQHEIRDAPIAVIGASRTGRAYLEMIRALGARPLLVDPTVDPAVAAALGAELCQLDDALQRSLIVAVHAPSLPETRHLIAARELTLMPDGAGLVNTARSWLVDEAALLAELRTGRISAAIDVFDEEPLGVDSAFRTVPNVLLTPHRAAGTHEGRLQQGRIVADELAALAAGETLCHAVTRAQMATMG